MTINLDHGSDVNNLKKDSYRSSMENATQSSVERRRNNSVEKMTKGLVKAKDSPNNIS